MGLPVNGLMAALHRPGLGLLFVCVGAGRWVVCCEGSGWGGGVGGVVAGGSAGGSGGGVELFSGGSSTCIGSSPGVCGLAVVGAATWAATEAESPMSSSVAVSAGGLAAIVVRRASA